MLRRGFTLIELLLAASLLCLLAGGFFYATNIELKIWQRIADHGEQEQLRVALLDRLARDIRAASEIIFSADPAELLLISGGRRVEYSLVNGMLRRASGNSAAYLTDAGQIDRFTVSYPGTRLVELELGGLTTRIGLRNRP